LHNVVGGDNARPTFDFDQCPRAGLRRNFAPVSQVDAGEPNRERRQLLRNLVMKIGGKFGYVQKLGLLHDSLYASHTGSYEPWRCIRNLVE
jgi:hypothetical protein